MVTDMMLRKYLTLFSLLIFIMYSASSCIVLGAPYGDVLWVETIGGDTTDKAYGIAIDKYGFIAVAGFTGSFGENGDAWALLLRSDGSILWQKVLGGNDIDCFYDVAVDNNGDFIFVGYTASFGSGSYDVWVMKITLTGKILWQKTIGGSGSDIGYAVAVTKDNDIVIVGSTRSAGTGTIDLLILKLSPDGSIIWQKIISTPKNDYGRDVAVDTDGNIYVTGFSLDPETGKSDIIILKLTSTGDLAWFKEIGGTGNDQGNAITVSPDGSLIVAGSTDSSGAGYTDMIIVKTTNEGNIIWARTYGLWFSDDIATDVAISPDHNIVVTGYNATPGLTDDAWLLELSQDGSLLWSLDFGWGGNDRILGIQVNNQSDIVLAGYTDLFLQDGKDLLIAKMNLEDKGIPGAKFIKQISGAQLLTPQLTQFTISPTILSGVLSVTKTNANPIIPAITKKVIIKYNPPPPPWLQKMFDLIKLLRRLIDFLEQIKFVII